MTHRFRIAAALAMVGFASFFNIRLVVDWTRREPLRVNQFVRDVEAAIPPDGRVLLVAPRLGGEERRLATALYPRVVYALPPGAKGLEDARAWAAERRLNWAVCLGGDPGFDPARSWIRRIDGGP